MSFHVRLRSHLLCSVLIVVDKVNIPRFPNRIGSIHHDGFPTVSSTIILVIFLWLPGSNLFISFFYLNTFRDVLRRLRFFIRLTVEWLLRSDGLSIRIKTRTLCIC